MKITSFLLSLLLCSSAALFAQNITEEQQSALTVSFSRFIPNGHIVLDAAMADFNNDGLRDIIIVSNDKNDPDQNRSLVILAATKDGYSVSAKSAAAVLCAGCGGVFGDPYAGLECKKNIVTIHHYGGSAWRWTSDFTFRFQNNQWELIGISQDSYINTEDCHGKGVGYAGKNMKEVNFSTKKLHIIKTTGTNCKPTKDQWIKLTSVPKILLTNFDVDKDYFKEMGY
jgi:hypothetical protein